MQVTSSEAGCWCQARCSWPFSTIVRNDRRPVDGLLTGVLGLALVPIWISFLLVIVPLQYFVTLVTGAPVRAAGASELRMWVDRTGNPIAFKTGPADQMPATAAEIDLSGHAVTATNAFSAVVLFAVSLFL